MENEDVMQSNSPSVEKEVKSGVLIRSSLEDLHPPYRLLRPAGTVYYTSVEYPDPAITGIIERTTIQSVLLSERRVVQASLYSADAFITLGSIEAMRRYFDSWKEIKAPSDMTPQAIQFRSVPASDGWGTTQEMYVSPDFYEYLVFSDERALDTIKEELKEKTFQEWLNKIKKSFSRAHKNSPHRVWVGNEEVYGANNLIWVGGQKVTNENGEGTHYEQNMKKVISRADFETACRKILFK